MKRYLVAALLPAFVLACADGDDPASPPREAPRSFTAQEIRLADSSTAFGLRLYQRVSAAETKPNLMVSPLSVSMSLGMTLNGAVGSTYDAMRSTLGFGNLSELEINEGYRGLIAQLLARDAGIEFTVANSVWHDRAFAVKAPFLDAARTYFNAEVRPIDFRDASAPKTISDWAERATNGRIKDAIKELRADEVMALINAIYFKALWQNQFITGDTRNRPFTRADGSTVTVPLMSKRAQFAAVRTADVIAAELPYANGAFNMLLVAPASGHSLAAVEAKMTPSWWKSLVDEVAAHKGDAVVTLPKFTFQYGLTLNEVLAALGMGIAMEIFRADFSRIKDPPPGLYISRVEHKTFIAVTEKGTEAGAVTITLIVPDSAPPEFVFDRPFVFAIREKSSGAILFIGRVSDPTP